MSPLSERSERPPFRFNRASDFRGDRSRHRIRVTLNRHNKWKRGWQSADPRNEVIIWGCREKGGRGIIQWVWRDQPI